MCVCVCALCCSGHDSWNMLEQTVLLFRSHVFRLHSHSFCVVKVIWETGVWEGMASLYHLENPCMEYDCWFFSWRHCRITWIVSVLKIAIVCYRHNALLNIWVCETKGEHLSHRGLKPIYHRHRVLFDMESINSIPLCVISNQRRWTLLAI